jgi:FkbM family methyltransferase
MPRDESLIFDVGMHNGDDTAYYLRRGYRVVAVEANPRLCAQARLRFEDAIAQGRLTIEPVAIAASSGLATFHITSSNTAFSSLDRRVASRDARAVEEITVTTRRLADLFGQFGVPHYLKIDIETGDGACLDALLLTPPSELPLYVSVEAHAVDYLSRLWAAGYRRFKIVDQLAHNSPAWRGVTNETTIGRSRRTVYHYTDRTFARWARREFPPGSSGPFGEDTPGEWQDLESVAYEWLHFKTGHHRRGSLNPRSWFDFHATF